MDQGTPDFSTDSRSARLKRNRSEFDTLFSLYPSLETWYQIDESEAPHLPPDFHSRLAIHIAILLEKHTAAETTFKVAELLERHITSPKMYIVLFKTMRLFTNKIETANFLAIIWRSLLQSAPRPAEAGRHIDQILRWMIDDYENNRLRHSFSDPANVHFKFSFLAYELGDHIISLYDTGNKNLDLIRQLYTSLINLVFEKINITEEISKNDSMLISGQFGRAKELLYFDRYIFNDIYEYIEYRTTEAGQANFYQMGIQHSIESLRLLLRNLGSIRAQVVQVNVREKTLQRNEELKNRLRKKNLTEEELITCVPYFTNGLKFFYLKNRYNFDVFNIVYSRYLLQAICVLAGFIPLVYSFLDSEYFSLTKGFGVFLIMCFLARFLFDKRYFKAGYPVQGYSELENFTEQFIYYFRKMTPEQLRAFGVQQIRSFDNHEYYQQIPEFLLHLYSSVPKEDPLLMSRTDLLTANQYFATLIGKDSNTSFKV